MVAPPVPQPVSVDGVSVQRGEELALAVHLVLLPGALVPAAVHPHILAIAFATAQEKIKHG